MRHCDVCTRWCVCVCVCARASGWSSIKTPDVVCDGFRTQQQPPLKLTDYTLNMTNQCYPLSGACEQAWGKSSQIIVINVVPMQKGSYLTVTQHDTVYRHLTVVQKTCLRKKEKRQRKEGERKRDQENTARRRFHFNCYNGTRKLTNNWIFAAALVVEQDHGRNIRYFGCWPLVMQSANCNLLKATAPLVTGTSLLLLTIWTAAVRLWQDYITTVWEEV